MMNLLNCFTDSNTGAIPITPVLPEQYAAWYATQPAYVQRWLQVNQYAAKSDSFCIIPNLQGEIERVIITLENFQMPWGFALLATALPDAIYYLDLLTDDDSCMEHFALVWGMQRYRFVRYMHETNLIAEKKSQLVLPVQSSIIKRLHCLLDAIYLTRDLINTPADDLGPAEIANAATDIAKKYNAQIKQCVGKALIQENYPAIYMVGRASTREPRLIEMTWGNESHLHLAIVGKGVCFDSGGLDIKPSSAMRLMKKDMGGAAHALALAQLIMAMQLPVYLKVYIAAVDNVIASNAYRPGDIVKTRKGLNIEVGNTDAEGRIILADALQAAAEQSPQLIIDFATLTGAARVALGTELPALFCNQPQIANELVEISQQVADPVWHMPLFKPYRNLINSSIADLDNAGGNGYGGAITAALFLQEFVGENIPWIHFDLMAWNLRARPGRPEGGEAMGLKTIFNYLIKWSEKNKS